MATFRPTRESVCKLNFDDKFYYELPLNEETIRNIAKIAEKQQKFLSELNNTDSETFNKAYNASLDALDEILGEGAGADIMSLYDKPDLFSIVEVITYISEEFNAAYSEKLNSMKATGTVPSVSRGRR